MTTSVSLLGVVLATASSFIVGSIWYNPSTFLKMWLKMTGTTEAQMNKRFGGAMAAIGLSSLVLAYVMAHFIIYAEKYTGASGISAGLQTALWLWLGISVTTIVSNGALEARDTKLMLLQAGNRLVTMLLMGLILGLFVK